MKKLITPVLITALIVAMWYYFSKDATNAGSNSPDVVFKKLAAQYGTAYAQDIEALFRYETAHFKSNQYLETYSAGMVATSDVFPFGWNSLAEFVGAGSRAGYGVSRVFSTSAGQKKYVKFPNLECSVFFVAWFVKNKRGGNVGQWNSLSPSDGAQYAAALNTISTTYN